MLPQAEDYDTLRAGFVWRIPEAYNIGADVCDRWAETEPGRLALIQIGEDGGRTQLTFGELRDESNRLANLLAAEGIGRGDRRRDLADFVLAKFEPAEHAELEEVITRAADAAEMFAVEGIEKVMNTYNPEATAPEVD